MQILKLAGSIGVSALLLCSAPSASAKDYTGTLDFGSKPAVDVTIPSPFGSVPGKVGFDLHRYSLGSALDGSVKLSFSAGTFNTQASMLGVLFASDPNDTIFNNPTSLIPGLVAMMTSTTSDPVTSFMNENVTGWNYLAFGTAIKPGGTANFRDLFDTPLNFNLGTPYHAFVLGGSAYKGSVLNDSTVGYTLSVTAVPEPSAWAAMLAGLCLMGGLARRRMQ